MLENILSEFKNRRRRKKILKYTGIFIVCSFLLVLISSRFKFIDFSFESYAPKKEINIQQNFEGELFFNDKPETTVFSDLIISEINNAKESIEIGMFSFNMYDIYYALLEARKRGVEITIVLDQSRKLKYDTTFGQASIFNVSGVGGDIETAGDYMHHKFLIIDRGTENQTLLEGSFNYTTIQEKYDPSFILKTSDDSVIEAFSEEYAIIKDGDRGYKKLRDDSYKPFNSKIQYENGFVEVWFGPGFKENSAKQRMLDLIESAQESIDIIIWRMTDEDIAKALFNKANSGVKVRILTDDYYIWSQGSAISNLFEGAVKKDLKNIEIVSDFRKTLNFKNEAEYFNPYLHQHTMIIDDSIVLSGTNNWTYNGFFKNDESVLISDVDFFVDGFMNSFDTNYKDSKGEKIEMNLLDNILTINIDENINGGKISIYNEISEIEEIPEVCFETSLDLGTKDYEIPEECLNTNSLYILLDKKNTFISSGYLYL